MRLIGIGNEFQCDDGVGLYIARELRKYSLLGARVDESNGDGALLVDMWQGEESVVLFDAIKSGAQPGTVYRFEAHVSALPAEFFSNSTHTFGVAQAIELARTLGKLPKELIVYGIEGQDFGPGVSLSLEVLDGARQVIERVLTEVMQHSMT